MPSHLCRIPAILVILAACSQACAGPAAISLHNGVNRFDLDGAAAGMAVLGHRENFNAHGFDVLSLYAKPERTSDWQLVSVFDGDKEALTLSASGGADCLLRDFRLVRDSPSDRVQLIVAERDAGSNYADPAAVHFKFYALRRNDAADVGRPLYYFELTRTTLAKRPFCDVGEAFIEELGIRPAKAAAR
jgi:hypothetical protein